MPQADDELREKIGKWFGSIDVHGPLEFLMSHGFTLGDAGIVYAPTQSHSLSRDEYSCVDFLVEEWDYGYERPDPITAEAAIRAHYKAQITGAL